MSLIDERVDELLKQRMAENPAVAQIVHDAQIFEDLKDSPAWRRLHERVESQERAYTAAVGKRIMAGDVVSQREIDFHRGWYRACRWILAHPEKAMDNLEDAARQALILMELELEQVGEKSPYE